jgi:hypothetical protein
MAVGAECANALAIALNNGFQAKDISALSSGVVNIEPIIVYTLKRN